MTQYDYNKCTDLKGDELLNISKIIKQYLDIKLKNLDSIVLFRIGEFYETYFEDAITLSKVCEVLLTKKDVGASKIVPMAGIPVSALDLYIKKLVTNRYKVALCEQDPEKKCKETGLLKRRVVRKFSPGTLCDSEFLDSESNNYIGAIFQKEKEFGFSYCDISTGEFFITQGGCLEILSEISKLGPSELLAPIKSRELVAFQVVQEEEADLDKEITSKHTPTLVPRSYFTNNLINCEFIEYELGNRCANAILAYVNETQQEYAPKLGSVCGYDIYEYLLLDENTRKNLELIKNSNDSKKYGSFFWAIDKTKTPMGKRLLQKWILQPLRNIEKIKERQDAVLELIKNKTAREALNTKLGECYDISRICAKISNNTISPRDFLALRDTFLNIEALKKVLGKCKSPFLNFIKDDYEELVDFSDILKRTISDEAVGGIKDGNIIKAGVSGELDYARLQIDTHQGWLKEFESTEKQNIKSLKLVYNKTLGYFIEVPISQVKSVPKNYKIKQTLSNCNRYTTDELKECEEKINLLTLKANDIEYEVFTKLREYSKSLVDGIRSFSYNLAQLDVLYSFCECATEDNFSKPELRENSVFEITNGRHPSAEKFCGKFIPNDLKFESKGFILLTGPNMVGKSTYLKQNALIAILAHMGSFIPAECGQISLLDRIFTRMGSVDDIINNNSTFMVEMLDTANILNNATSKSLILLDELGKNTSVQDGIAIARAVSEYIIENIGAKTIFATHFHKLSELEEKYSNVENYMIGADFSRKVEKGVLNKSYGINIAKMAGLPKKVIEDAEKYLSLP